MKKNKINVEFEILQASHLEHFKAAKDLAMLYPLGNERRKSIETELNTITSRLEVLKKQKHNGNKVHKANRSKF